MTAPAVLVFVPRNMGGVRNVTACLAAAIGDAGRRVVVAGSLWEVVKARYGSHATTAILSLEAGFLAWMFSRSIYVLHGFPVASSPLPKRFGIAWAARFARLGGARLVAVSQLTRAVNERVFGIPIDEVILNGCSESLITWARARAEGGKRKVVTYLGRLIDDKRIQTVVTGFLASRLPSLGYVLKVAGSGARSAWVAGAARARPEIEMLGEISDEAEKASLLFESEAVVSLNDMEPMGVVFVEAMLARCKIVAPHCGGHREFIPSHHPLSLCDPTELASVAAAFDRVPELPEPAPLEDPGMFSYRARIAPAYLRLLDEPAATTGAAAAVLAARRDEPGDPGVAA